MVHQRQINLCCEIVNRNKHNFPFDLILQNPLNKHFAISKSERY